MFSGGNGCCWNRNQCFIFSLYFKTASSSKGEKEKKFPFFFNFNNDFSIVVVRRTKKKKSFFCFFLSLSPLMLTWVNFTLDDNVFDQPTKKKKKIHFFSFREKKETEKIMYMEGEKQTRKKQKYFVLLNFVHLVFWKTKNKSLKFFKLFYYNSDLDRWEQQSTEGSFFFFLSTELVVK